MEKQYEKKITWTIKNFSTLQSKKIYSDYFVVGGCKWHTLAYPKGTVRSWFSLYLEAADCDSLPSGWRRFAKYRLAVVDQLSEERSKPQESQNWFNEEDPSWGFGKMLPLADILDKNGGFLLNGQVKVIVEVDVLEVISKSDVLEEYSSVIMERIDVHGFQVFPSQVESVKSMFKEHPDIASKFRQKNPNIRVTYLNVLLSLIEILCKSPEELSNGDLAEAYRALRFVTKAGFKVDWLEKKLKEAGETRREETKEKLTRY